jgi:succinate dehydrogenase / fumarate reductase cytochrome b subunit
VNNKRPVNLDIGSIRLPITSYVSILHRLSGVFLFVATACLLWAFDASLASEQSFQSLKECLAGPLAQAVLWLILVAFAYHLIAGIRHLVMDFGIGEDSFESGRRSAWLAVVAIAIAVLLISGWVFLW